MDIEFTPDLESRIARHAAQQGLPPSQAVQDVVARFFDERDRFAAAVEHGEAAFHRGEILTHEQVGERLSRFLQP
jgi:predicted transcriptional regulator